MGGGSTGWQQPEQGLPVYNHPGMAVIEESPRALYPLSGGGDCPTEDFVEAFDDPMIEADAEVAVISGTGDAVMPQLGGARLCLEETRVVDVFGDSGTLLPHLPEGGSYTEGGTPGNETDGTVVHKLMHVTSDKLDLSFVEKVIVPAHEIQNLCNAISPSAASLRDGKSQLDFGLLNKTTMQVVGMYGSKRVLVEIFRRLGLSCVVTLLKGEKLEAGIYGFRHERVLYVFYWHLGQRMDEASRKDVSCNFIRYVMDLSGTVYVCLDAQDMEASLETRHSSAGTRKQRIQRLQISLVKKSENDLKMSRGFVISPSKGLPNGWLEGAQSSTTESRINLTPRLFSSLHRCAVLTARRCPPRAVHHKQSERLAVKELPGLFRAWSNKYNVDVTQLPDADLINLVELADLEGSDDYWALMDDVEHKREAQRQKFWKMEELLRTEEAKVLSILGGAQQAYLELSHPWEETFLRNTASSFPVDQDKKCARGTAEQGEPQNTSSKASADNQLHDAHIALSNLWNRERDNPGSDPPSLILVGSEIQILLDKGYYIELGGEEEFVILSSKPKHGPILYGEEFVLRKKRNSEPFPGQMFIAHCVEGVCPNGPVLSSDYVRIEVKGNARQSAFFENTQKTHRLKLVLRGGSSKAMHDWLASYGTTVFPTLDKRVVDLAFVMGNPNLFGPHVCAETFFNVCTLSESDSPLSGFQKTFSQERMHALISKAKQAQPDYSSERRQDYLRNLNSSERQMLIGVCTKVYEEACSQFSKRITCMVKDLVTPMLKQRMEMERTVGSDSLEKDSERARSECLNVLRSRLSSGKLPDKRTLAVKSCTLCTKRWSITRYFRKAPKDSGDEEVELHFVTEEVESEQVEWRMVELTPMKKDLDALLQRDTHVVVPGCSANYKLIDVDPTFQRLSAVFPIKSGEVLVFVEDYRESAIHLYLIPKLGPDLASNPIKTFRRGRDLVAVDEAARLVAFYDKAFLKISIFRFDESFRHFEWIGVEILLSDYVGSRTLTSMMFIPGKREILLVDSDLKVRVCEISLPAMMRPRHIVLPGPDHKMCISPDGSCLLVFRSSEARKEDVLHDTEIECERDSQKAGECNDDEGLTLDVYLLDGTMSLLKTLKVTDISGDVRRIDVSTVAFGSQSHLILIDTLRPDRGICSQVLEVTSASEVCQLQALSNTGNKDDVGSTSEVQKNVSCPSLDYVHHVFDKYAVSPPLVSGERELCVHVLLEGEPEPKAFRFKEKCVGYLESCIDKLKRDKGKSFSKLSLSFASDFVSRYIFKQTLVGTWETRNYVYMGDWVRLLVSLVPIQIARAENNGLRPLIDGLQISSNMNYADAVGLAEALRFGFYDSVLTQWKGPVKVISSMGKQSSGKSYLLNHLSGSLLDVAGGRCTDGVWMTMRASNGCLYVLLDFEGLGSFERSEQEDMLLSILNAAMSNMTIFNKKDFHLDKETESVFERFQNGVSIVKEDSRLFKGLFYMAIKDVDIADIEDLKAEFYTKIQQICSKSQDNFLTKMYGGQVEVAAMPPFQRVDYHDSVADIAAAVDEIKPIHHSGKSLMVDLKLVIAQISARDWSPLDTKRLALRLELLKMHLITAVNLGRLASDSDNVLVNFETQEPIAESALLVEGRTFSLGDTGLELSPRQESQVMGDVLENLRQHFQNGYRRIGDDDEVWHSTYEKFLLALADRRKLRVLEWLRCNTSEFQDDGDVQKLLLETAVVLAELKQRLSLCSSKCKNCFLRCVREKSHPGETSMHSCLGGHRCQERCSFCLIECPEQKEFANSCSDLSGHEGPHDCKLKSHTCGEDCTFMRRSSNCNESCALKPGHAGDHVCNTKQHICDQGCSLCGCKNSCMISLDSGDHDRHICQERMCPMDCTIKGCNRKCGSEDHFHSLSSDRHLCGNEHTCPEKCESPGICHITTEVVTVSKTFIGKRSAFEYEHVSQQNGIRKACCIAIPPGEETHSGNHCHTSNPNAVHFCETKCSACGYLCNLPICHAGVHDTTHGNMRDVHFAAEAAHIDLEDRKYEWGESGKAEMCMMHCKAQGRGHIHLIRCLAHAIPKGPCAEGLYDGARHQTQEYGPDKGVAKDELSHAAYWKQMRFKDPCNDEDQKQFQLCNHFCRSDEHVPAATSGKNSTELRSYCTEKMWHAPVSRTGSESSSAGYVTEDGHSFVCNHLKNTANHVVFVIDRSGSMGSSDTKPTLAKFAHRFNNRLGCVYEAILRFIVTRSQAGQQDVVSIILFDTFGSIAVELQPISEHLVDLLLSFSVGGGTTYSSGLTLAEQVLQRGLHDLSMQAKHPAVVFLSDGGNNGGSNPLTTITKMMDMDHRLVFHTILFGKDHVDQDILRRMAKAGNGSFQVSIDEVQLARSFEGLAKSLRPKVSSLMN